MTTTRRDWSRTERAGPVGLARAIVVALVLVLAIAAGAGGRGAARAQAVPAAGLDLDTSGNTATSLGPIDACTRVHAGAYFDVDIYVKDVPPIDGVQVTLQFDAAILRPVDYDVNLFLNVAPGSQVTRIEKPAAEPGTYTVAGFDFGQDSAESGSGAAIRITFEALSAGRSDVRVAELLMEDGGGSSVQPADGVGRFTGAMTSGVVGVDAACDAGPEPTPQPGRTPAPTPEPSSAAATATAEAGGPETAGDATAAAAASELTPGAAATGEAGAVQPGAAGAAGAAPTFRSDTRANSKTPGAVGQAGAAGDPQQGSTDSGFSLLWWLLIGVGALVLVGAGAVVWRRYGSARGG